MVCVASIAKHTIQHILVSPCVAHRSQDTERQNQTVYVLPAAGGREGLGPLLSLGSEKDGIY